MEDAEHTVIHRQLGLHERYCVARHNVGAPPILIFVAEATSGASTAFISSHLSRRINDLLDLYPLLSCHVAESRTRQPKFVQQASVAIDDVLCITTATSASADALITERFNQPAIADVRRGPLWKVEVVTDANSRGPTFVVLTVHHTIADGRGSANLFQLLLGQGVTGKATAVAVPPPPSDKMVPMAPTLTYIVPKAFLALMVPRLPEVVQRYLVPIKPWLCDRPVRCPAKTALKSTNVLYFPGAGPILKRLSRSHRVPTINSTIHSACVVACLALAGTSPQPLHLSSDTPISERIVSSCTPCTGNYVSLFEWKSNIESATPFWELTRDYATKIASPGSRATARQAIGALAFLPDAKDWHSTSDRPTQWEDYLLAQSERRSPFGATFALSNLGRIDAPDWVKQLAWAQRPPLASTPLTIDACGRGNEVILSVGYHVGVLPLEVEHYASKLSEVMYRLLELEDDKEITLGDLAQGVAKHS